MQFFRDLYNARTKLLKKFKYSPNPDGSILISREIHFDNSYLVLCKKNCIVSLFYQKDNFQFTYEKKAPYAPFVYACKWNVVFNKNLITIERNIKTESCGIIGSETSLIFIKNEMVIAALDSSEISFVRKKDTITKELSEENQENLMGDLMDIINDSFPEVEEAIYQENFSITTHNFFRSNSSTNEPLLAKPIVDLILSY